MIETSEQVTEIFKALSKAQAKIRGAAKDSTNPHFKSKYADLASVWEACREALTGEGLAVAQFPVNDDPDVIKMTTLLCHASGQWMRGTFSMRPTKNDPQGQGSAITYARRYALAAVVGVAPEDDDGNAASAEPDYQAIVQKHLAILEDVRLLLDINETDEGFAAHVEEARAKLKEIPQADLLILWKAPTKGGWFTVRERKLLKDGNLRAAA